MAQLKKLPSISSSKVNANLDTTTFLATNRNNKNRIPNSLFNYSISNANTVKNGPPRRYFDQNRRVLSPEPENRYTPTVKKY